jgi:hypothetical protein
MTAAFKLHFGHTGNSALHVIACTTILLAVSSMIPSASTPARFSQSRGIGASSLVFLGSYFFLRGIKPHPVALREPARGGTDHMTF